MIFVFCNNNNAAWLAAGCFSLSLLILLFAIIRVLNRFLEPDDKGLNYRSISSYIKYSTDDGENISFENHRVIQVKCSLMQIFDMGFKWTGNKSIQITSELQDVQRIKSNENEEEYDSAVLALRKPALYNETIVIHFKSKMNDADRISVPKVGIAVTSPVEFVQFTVSLKYKDDNFNKTAKVQRRKINSQTPNEYATIGSVTFDKISKQYEYSLVNPEPGYFYHLIWDR